MDGLIVGRVIAGAGKSRQPQACMAYRIYAKCYRSPGGAGMYLGVLNYVAVYTTIRERPLYTAAIGIFWGTGTILGPVVGGAFVSIYTLMLRSVLMLTDVGK